MKKLKAVMGALLLSGLVAGAHAANPSAKVFTVGQYYEGGVIYWTDPAQKNQHGLIADINDQPGAAAYAWSTTNTTTGAINNGAYAGRTNTTIIVNSGIIAPAASACVNSGAQGYHDWYLPSEMELGMMFVNQMAITRTAQANGGSAFASINAVGNAADYWSSIELDADNAWRFAFNAGGQRNLTKNFTLSVRCVRAF